MRHSFIRLIVVAATLAASLATAANALAGPVLPIYDGPPSAKTMQMRPNEITYTGDGSGFLAGRRVAGGPRDAGRLHWTGWSALQGRAWGSDWLDNCTPDCASGRFTPYDVNVHAYRPRRLGGWLIFTRLSVTFTAKRPAFVHSRTVTFKITYQPGGGFFY